MYEETHSIYTFSLQHMEKQNKIETSFQFPCKEFCNCALKNIKLPQRQKYTLIEKKSLHWKMVYFVLFYVLCHNI